MKDVYVKNTTKRGWNALQIDRVMSETCFPWVGMMEKSDAEVYNERWKGKAFIMPFCGQCKNWCFTMWSPDPPIEDLNFINDNYIKITEEEFNLKYRDKIFNSGKEMSEDIIAKREK